MQRHATQRAAVMEIGPNCRRLKINIRNLAVTAIIRTVSASYSKHLPDQKQAASARSVESTRGLLQDKTSARGQCFIKDIISHLGW